MSSVQQLAVLPRLPTTLSDQTHLELLGYDLWFYYVKTLHVVPTVLDVPRFKEALSRALQIYPHGAGKFRHVDGRWVIELTNSPIPLDIEYKVDSGSDSLSGDWINQGNISSFTNAPPIGANIFDDSVPLICVKLTFFCGETYIGVAWQHSLGDATAQFRFLHTLSQFYQGLSAGCAPPSFKRPHLPTPSDSVATEIWPHIPYLHKTCSFEELRAFVSQQRFECVRWRIESRDIDELRSALSSKKQDGPSLSKQDCIAAYLVAIFNRSSSIPLRSVRHALTYRHIIAPFIDENAASNLMITVGANVCPEIAGTATSIRNAVIQSRDPDYIYRWLMVTSDIKSKAYNALRAVRFPGDNDELFVNAVTQVDWWSAHFGCPDGTRYYTEGQHWQYASVNRPNPVKGADGVWRARQSVEISIGVAPEVKPKLLEAVALGIRHVLNLDLNKTVPETNVAV